MVRKDAIRIYPSLINDDNKLHMLELIDLKGNTKTEAQLGKLVSNVKPKDNHTISFNGKVYYFMESCLAKYNIYVERFPKHGHKNGIAAMLTNQEDVCGEAIVVGAKSKRWWRRAKELDPTDFLESLTRLNPNLKTLPNWKPTLKKAALSSL